MRKKDGGMGNRKIALIFFPKSKGEGKIMKGRDRKEPEEGTQNKGRKN